MQYVVKCEDEATKNHKKNEHDIVSGYMPSIDNKYCPVKSFIKYTQSLHPESNKLWQTPKYNRFPTNSKDIWYGPGNVGHNKLDSFTTNIAKKCGLHDKGYTNHSLRASGKPTLKHNDFNDKQVMSVTGHRSCMARYYCQNSIVVSRTSEQHLLESSWPTNNLTIQIK